MENVSIRQKLASLSDSLDKKELLKEFWGDKAEEFKDINIVVKFDTVNNIIRVQSTEVDAKDRPVLEWEMNKNTGHITETKRTADGSEVSVREKDIDVATLTS